MGSNKKSSMGACKSYCMNFNYFKIVDSSLQIGRASCRERVCLILYFRVLYPKAL